MPQIRHIQRPSREAVGRAPRARLRTLALLALGLLALAALVPAGGTAGAGSQRPNFVVVQTDDQTLHELYSTWINPEGIEARTMPQTLDEIRKRGITFSRHYVSYPLCCPSRATLLSGRYAHGHGVLSNDAPRGGYYAGYKSRTIFDNNLATWLDGAGYRTIHIGKFMNNYGGRDNPPETEVPPGWDNWQTLATDNSTRLFYGYRLNVDGNIQGPFGNTNYATTGRDDPGCPDSPPPLTPCNYTTDVLTQRALEQIQLASGPRPFFMLLDYIAPHGDQQPPIGPEPATRHYDSAINTFLPRPPSFNEGDISDKPSFIRDAAPPFEPTNVRRIRIEYQKSLESLRSVDDGIGKVVGLLRALGELRNTYVVFTTDNGFFLGEHRLERAKFLPYEPAVHAPLLIAGPGIKAGSQSGELVTNADIAPTFLDLANVRATRRLDGRSLVSFWRDTSRRTRRPILLESFAKATDIDGDGIPDGRRPRRGAGASISAPPENYLGVRIGPYKYIEYETGDRELYDLSKDPDELRSRHADLAYDRVQRYLKRLIERLEGCVGKVCREVAGPLPDPQAPAIPRDPIRQGR
jgi:N-acetylglucosamine-6-sulfatase